MVNNGEINNIMPLSIMKSIGLECIGHFKTDEGIFAIDSEKVTTYGEIKDFCAWIASAPHVKTLFTIIVVDLPPTYGLVLGWEWTFPSGGYIMNDGSCMMIPNKCGEFTKIPREPKNMVFFKIKANDGFESFLDFGLGSYVVLEEENPISHTDESLWKMYFDGSCSKNGVGVGIVL